MISKIKEYLKYPSTWAGIASALALVGVQFSPEQADLFTKAGIGLVAFILTFFSDSDVKKVK